MSPANPIRVVVYGFDDRAKNLLELFFSGPCKGHLILVSDEKAEVGLVDIDSPQGRELFKRKVIQWPKRPLVITSLHEEKDNEVPFFINKPMRLKVVLDVLQKAAQKARSKTVQKAVAITVPEERSEQKKPAQPPEVKAVSREQPKQPTESIREVGSFSKTQSISTAHVADTLDHNQFIHFMQHAQGIDLSQEVRSTNLFYVVTEYLQGHFQKACDMAAKQQQAIRLGGAWGNFYIDPNHDTVFAKSADNRLRPMTILHIPDTQVEMEPMTVNELEARIGSFKKVLHSTSIEAMVWKLALWTSRGRLPLKTDVKAPLWLRRWPNFTRIIETPNSMRMVALWAHQPATIEDAMEALNISQAEAFTVCSALLAVDCLRAGRRQSDSMISPVPVMPAAERGLFKRILSHILG